MVASLELTVLIQVANGHTKPQNKHPLDFHKSPEFCKLIITVTHSKFNISSPNIILAYNQFNE